MKPVLIALGFCVLMAEAGFAASLKPVEYRGMNIKTVVQSSNARTSTVFLLFFNPNEKPAEVRNISCEFHQGERLVKKFTIARLTARPGEGEYEAPEKLDAPFNRPICKVGKP
ncbi:hypothetical protein [Microvirga terricola]|uniref:Uncharacterized protein n=1 Tax=Microvirga terricola TaxID=2719797 RepID=A0ABX0V9M7_9HYPH|nr:hypothetical protein [Microvirga terricola]NIX75741.1 hypothetical protein [Microvirga terricola]